MCGPLTPLAHSKTRRVYAGLPWHVNLRRCLETVRRRAFKASVPHSRLRASRCSWCRRGTGGGCEGAELGWQSSLSRLSAKQMILERRSSTPPTSASPATPTPRPRIPLESAYLNRAQAFNRWIDFQRGTHVESSNLAEYYEDLKKNAVGRKAACADRGPTDESTWLKREGKDCGNCDSSKSRTMRDDLQSSR